MWRGKKITGNTNMREKQYAVNLFVADGRGQIQKQKAQENFYRVLDWMIKNPGRTQTDCSRDLGLCTKTVRKHMMDVMERVSRRTYSE
jgi:hypothetical protein